MDKKKILVVEDEEQMNKMVALELEAAGYDVVNARDGEEGLRLANEEIPDLIISDVLMPVMDGFIKKSKMTSEIPVLILTARGKMEDSFRVVGADEFVSKPFESEDLIVKVQQLLARGAHHEGASPRAPKRVLVVGDDSETIENMALQLKRQGCHVDFVTTGAQAISKAVMFLPNIIIMEVNMRICLPLRSLILCVKCHNSRKCR